MDQLRNVVIIQLGEPSDPGAAGAVGAAGAAGASSGAAASPSSPSSSQASSPSPSPGTTFAAELRWIREIATLGYVTFLPSAPLPICGVVNAHGAITPVIDLAELLLLPSSGLPRQGDPALIVEVDHVVAAFRVDSIRHVATLPQQPPQPIAVAIPPRPTPASGTSSPSASASSQSPSTSSASSSPSESIASPAATGANPPPTRLAIRPTEWLAGHVIDRDGTAIPLLDLPSLLRRCGQLVSAAARAGATGAAGAP